MSSDGVKMFTALCLLGILIACASVSGGCLSGVSPAEEEAGITGTVTWLSPDDGLYAINGDDGVMYYPVNLDPALAKNNTRVSFTFVTPDEDVSAVTWGKPVKIISVRIIEGSPRPVYPHTFTLEESRQTAEQYVLSTKEYTGYDGANLTLPEVVTLKCPSCWKFVYTYDMRSVKDPAVSDRALVEVTVQSGKITDVVSSYGKKR
jgi:hypothetical protein